MQANFLKMRGKNNSRRSGNQGGRGRSQSQSDDKKFQENKTFKSSKFKKQGKGNTTSAHSKPGAKKPYSKKSSPNLPGNNEVNGVRLNKFLANSGVCSRREADRLIEAGVVEINGKVVTELGTRVMEGDTVKYGGETLNPENLVYLLLNKPKDFITTVSDPQGRRTVLQLIANACKERIYPVGRLDRMTTGLLLFTNDGDLAKKLTHPSFGVKKIYHVTLDKNVTHRDIVQLLKGVDLEDGTVKADKAEYVKAEGSKKEIGIELHSGKNRVIRRMMEALGYKVVKLDRVYFAGLTKKNLPRGKYRMLDPKEVAMLKMQS